MPCSRQIEAEARQLGIPLTTLIVAQASRREIIIVDETKLVPALGTGWAIPIEVIPFGWGSQAAFLESLGGRPVRRSGEGGQPFLTDQGNYILDTDFGPIAEPAGLAHKLNERVGIVEHGLFLGLVHDVIMAGQEGIRHLRRGE